MADLTFNRLSVTDDNKGKGAHILELLMEEGMEYFIPRPSYLLNEKLEDMQVFNPEWKKWSIHNWGTKWDIYKEERYLYKEDNTIVCEFITANGSIEPFVTFLRTTFPEMIWQLSYCEEGYSDINYF